MKNGVRVAGTVAAIVLLGCNAALLIDWKFSHLEEARFVGVQHAAPKKDKQGQAADPEQASVHAVAAPLAPGMIGPEAERQQGQGAAEPGHASKEQDGPYVFLWRWLAWLVNATISGTHFTDWAIAFAGVASAITAAFQYKVYREQAGIMKLQADISASIVDLEQPYLLVNTVKDFGFVRIEELGKHESYYKVSAKVDILNYGRTPAILSMVQATVVFVKMIPTELDFSLCFAEFYDDIVSTERGDVFTAEIKGIRFHHEMMNGIESGRFSTFVYGRLRYFNGIGGIVESSFAFEVAGINAKCVRSRHPKHNYRKVYNSTEAPPVREQMQHPPRLRR